MILDKYIANLLYDHNCVIIPSFGAFIANYQASAIDEKQQIIKPPNKQIAFNPSLNSNDALLAHHVSGEEGINFDQASENIDLIVKSWNEKLKKGQSLRLNKIGELSLNTDQKIIFKPYNSVNFLKESFGLQDLSIQTVARKRITLDTTLLQELQQEQKVERHRNISNRKNRRIVYVAVTAYLPILIGLWALFLLKEPFTGQESGFRIFERDTTVEVNQADIKEVETIDAAEEVLVVAKAEVKESEQVEDVFIPEALPGPLYYIIGGSFKNSDNAENFQGILLNKNYPRSEILDGNNGYFRVSYDRFELSNEALNYLQTINKNENSAAWILKY